MDRSSVYSKNRYALLSDSDDMDSIQEVEQSIKKMTIEAESDTATRGSCRGSKEAKGVTASGESNSERSIFAMQQTSESTSHSEGKFQHPDVKGSHKKKKSHFQFASLPEKSEDWIETQKKEKVRPRRGKGGPPRREPFSDRGKREFDRLSGSQKSGVKPVEKRDGGGARNWGRLGDNYEILQEEDQSTTDVPVGAAENVESKGASTTSKPNDGAVKEMTLDEWKEQIKSSLRAPAYKLRKPGEGTDQKQWGKYQVLKKKTLEDPSHEEVTQAHISEPKLSSKAAKSIDVLFSDEPYSSHYYQARHGRRGPEPSRATRKSADLKETSTKTRSPQFDENDFPSLGGT